MYIYNWKMIIGIKYHNEYNQERILRLQWCSGK